MHIKIILDFLAFLFCYLSFFYSIKIYLLFRTKNFLFLILATLYGCILRAFHFLRNFNLPVPDALTVSRLFSIFYILLFFGIALCYVALEKGIRNMKQS